MAEQGRFLQARERKAFFKLIENQWGKVPEIFKRVSFFRSGKEKVYIVNKELDLLDLRKFRISSIGLYIAEVKSGLPRLSIEGSQLVGPVATRNVAEVTTEELKAWLRGENLVKSGPWQGFVIIKHGNDFAGSGKYQDGLILNHVPKARRLQEVV